MKLYYAHPMSWYHSEEEFADMDYLRQHFPEYKVVNPNSPAFDARVRNALIEGRETMSVFLDWIKAEADAVVVRPFSDGHIGAGVGQEALTAHLWGKDLYMFSKTSNIHWVPFSTVAHEGILTVAATKQRIKDGIK